MIGLRQLSHNRLELFASRFPLDALKPYLLSNYREAFAVIVLYEDNIEVYHETGIFSFDASEPETFNYEEFRAPLIEEFRDRLAICTVENLFLHLQATMEEKPMEDDPFHNLVFSILLTPPSREVLLDWERNIDHRLKRVLYDQRSTDHFLLFPYEMCVVYSHGNYYTSVTSEQEDLIQAVFEDIVERQLASISSPPFNPQFIAALYGHVKQYRTIRIKTERVHRDKSRQPFLLMTYPKRATFWTKPVARLMLDDTGNPVSFTEPEWISRLRYNLQYRDPILLPIVLILLLMGLTVAIVLYYRLNFPAP